MNGFACEIYTKNEFFQWSKLKNLHFVDNARHEQQFLCLAYPLSILPVEIRSHRLCTWDRLLCQSLTAQHDHEAKYQYKIRSINTFSFEICMSKPEHSLSRQRNGPTWSWSVASHGGKDWPKCYVNTMDWQDDERWMDPKTRETLLFSSIVVELKWVFLFVYNW